MSDQEHERTRRLDDPGGSGRTAPLSYTEEYTAEEPAARPGPRDRYVGAEPVGSYVEDSERTMVDHAPPPRRPPEQVEETDAHVGRRFSTPALVFTGIISLLLGVILALMLLPEEDPTVALQDTAAQQALADAAATNAEAQAALQALQAANAQLQADNAQLRADLAERDARIAELESQAAGDQAAAGQAQDDRQAALDEREAALAQREAALDQREAALDEQEAAAASGSGDAPQTAEGDGGIPLPDLGEIEVPQIDEEQARGIVERLVERLQDLLGIGG